MTRRRKILIGVAAGALVTGFTLWFLIPTIFRWQVNKKPGVHVDRVDVHLRAKCLDLYGVTVDRGWVKGRLDKARVCDDKTVVAEGGDLTVLLDQRTKGSGGDSESYKVTASHLTTHVTKGDVQADLADVTVTDTEIRAEAATVKHPKGEVKTGRIYINRDGTQVSFPKATVTPKVKLFDREVGEVSLGPTTVMLKEGKLSISSVEVEGVTATAINITYVDSLVTAKARRIHFNHPRLHSEPLTFADVEFGPINPTKPLEGDHTIRANGISLGFNLKEQHLWGAQTCQEWYDAVPAELRTGVMGGLTFKGDFKFDLHLKPAVKLDWTLTCKNPQPAPAFIMALRKPFTYVAFDKNGKEFSRKTGPGTIDWVPFEGVNRNMVTALMTTEDPGFFDHKGFIRQAVENSLVDNLKAGKALRGASTITMQLAKNLWLKRSKTLGRKVQEAFLTLVLESHLKKDEILELYLNVVEFGPDLYGIGPASRELLTIDPMNLSLVDSLYLALRLPRPSKAGPLDVHKKAVIKTLLARLTAAGKVTEDIAAAEAAMMDEADMVYHLPKGKEP